MELCLALTAAVSSSHNQISSYLLGHVHHQVLHTLSMDILKAAGEHSSGSSKGTAFLLQADLLNNQESTYQIADNLARSENDAVPSEFQMFLLKEWSKDACQKGQLLGQAHHLNVMRALKRGSSPLHLQELPLQLQVSVAYLPLYKECVGVNGVVLSQWLRGQLVEATLRLNQDGLMPLEEAPIKLSKHQLLLILESRMPSFLLCTEGKI